RHAGSGCGLWAAVRMERALGTTPLRLSRTEYRLLAGAHPRLTRPDAAAHDRLSSGQWLLGDRACAGPIGRYHDGILAARGSDDGDPLRLGRCRVIAAPSVAPWDRREGVARCARNSLRPVWRVGRFPGPAPGARGRCGRRATGAARL